MSGMVLVLGDSRDWREALAMDLTLDGIPAEEVGRVEQAEAKLRGVADAVAGVVIAAYGARPGGPQGAGSSVDAALAAGIRLCDAAPGVPMLFVAPVPSLLLTMYARQSKLAEIVPNEAPATIRDALARLRPAAAALAPPVGSSRCCATVEITVDVASISFVATINPGQEVIAQTRLPWDGLPRTRSWEGLFSNWRLMRPGPAGVPEPDANWPDMLRSVGEYIAAEVGLGKTEQARALERCLQRVSSLGNIHFRFTLPAGLMGNVPFDLVFDSDRNFFLREVAPVARRISLKDNERIRLPAPGTGRAALTGRVLCVLADAHGSLRIPGRSFLGRPSLEPRRLQHLRTELARAFAMRRGARLPRPVLLNLAKCASPLAALLGALRAGPWDIVHFAGHSVRDDSGEVLLVLPPGREESWPAAARVADFAQAAVEGRTGLVVLSSCESSTPDTVFRMAQAGAPAVIGFRWEVDDAEASMFTATLHEHLAAGMPLAQAYQAAVSRLRGDRLSSPTFASPILAVQDESWAVGGHPQAPRPRSAA